MTFSNTGYLVTGTVIANNAVFVGNSVANISANSILFQVINSTAQINIGPTSLVTGQTTVNSISLDIGNSVSNTLINSTSVFIGGNVELTTLDLSIGNSTQNTFVNSIGFYVNGTNVTATVHVPTRQVIGGNGTYTIPANCVWIVVEGVGGGGGGGGTANPGGANGISGGNTTFGGSSFLLGVGGTGGFNVSAGTIGGSASGGDYNIPGGDGGASEAPVASTGGAGGSSYFGGGGAGGPFNNPGETGQAPGSGGGGGGANATVDWSGSGGAAGGYFNKIIANPNTTYGVVVGPGGTGGANSAGGYAGGNGAAGIIIVTEHYSSYLGGGGGGGGSNGIPGGANTNVQTNDNGTFNGTAGFTYNKTTNNVFMSNTLTVANNLIVTNAIFTSGSQGAFGAYDRGSSNLSFFYRSGSNTRFYNQEASDVFWYDTAGNVWANSNIYVKGPSPWADVRAFGAKCDGATDDTTTVQAAINFLETSYGGEVRFPPGWCYVAGGVTVNGAVTLVGAGQGCSLLSTQLPGTRNLSPGTSVITFTDNANYSGARNLFILAANTASGSGCVIALGSANGSVGGTLDTCQIYGNYWGIITYTATNWCIRNCLISGVQGAVYSQGANWYSDTKWDTGWQSTNSYYGFVQGPPVGGSTAVQENQISQGDCSGTYTYNLYIDDGGNNTALTKFKDCTFGLADAQLGLVQINNARWTAFVACEFTGNPITVGTNKTSFAACYAFAGVTISGAGKALDGTCFNMS